MTKEQSPEEKAFREAIKAARGEGTPKLAYATWLDAHDQPERAAALRLQVERSNVRTAAWTRRVCPTEPIEVNQDQIQWPTDHLTQRFRQQTLGDGGTNSVRYIDMRFAEDNYFQSVLYASFGRRAMHLMTEGIETLWREKQEENPPQSAEGFVRDRRRELVDLYERFGIVSNREQALAFANEIATQAQDFARRYVAERVRGR
jgi:uncharacterized protein (TIGR02996 family)